MEEFPNNRENRVGENNSAEILAEMPAFEKRNAVEDKYAAEEFNTSIYEGTVFARDYDFDDYFYTSKVKIAPAFLVERPIVEKKAIRFVADQIAKSCDSENDSYNTQVKNTTKIDILHNLFEGQSLEKQTAEALKGLSDKVDGILIQEDLRDAKIDISKTGVFYLACISEVRDSMREAYEELQNI